MTRARDLGAHVAHVVGLDSTHDTTPDHDPDLPRDPDPSHEWVLCDRWAFCATCGARDHWPGGTVPCTGPKIKGKRPAVDVPRSEGLTALLRDVAEFHAWWVARPEFGDTRPSVDEWAAEFWAWRGHPGRRL